MRYRNIFHLNSPSDIQRLQEMLAQHGRSFHYINDHNKISSKTYLAPVAKLTKEDTMPQLGLYASVDIEASAQNPYFLGYYIGEKYIKAADYSIDEHYSFITEDFCINATNMGNFAVFINNSGSGTVINTISVVNKKATKIELWLIDSIKAGEQILYNYGPEFEITLQKDGSLLYPINPWDTDENVAEIYENNKKDYVLLQDCDDNVKQYFSQYFNIKHEQAYIPRSIVYILNNRLSELSEFINSDIADRGKRASTVRKSIIPRCELYVLECDEGGYFKHPQIIHEISPLIVAADIGNVEAVSLLIKQGATIDRQLMSSMETPLHRALNNKHNNVSEVLLQAGASLAVQDRKNKSILHLYAEQSIISDNERELIRKKISSRHFNLLDDDGNDPYHVASEKNSPLIDIFNVPYQMSCQEYSNKKSNDEETATMLSELINAGLLALYEQYKEQYKHALPDNFCELGLIKKTYHLYMVFKENEDALVQLKKIAANEVTLIDKLLNTTPEREKARTINTLDNLATRLMAKNTEEYDYYQVFYNELFGLRINRKLKDELKITYPNEWLFYSFKTSPAAKSKGEQLNQVLSHKADVGQSLYYFFRKVYELIKADEKLRDKYKAIFPVPYQWFCFEQDAGLGKRYAEWFNLQVDKQHELGISDFALHRRVYHKIKDKEYLKAIYEYYFMPNVPWLTAELKLEIPEAIVESDGYDGPIKDYEAGLFSNEQCGNAIKQNMSGTINKKVLEALVREGDPDNYDENEITMQYEKAIKKIQEDERVELFTEQFFVDNDNNNVISPPDFSVVREPMEVNVESQIATSDLSSPLLIEDSISVKIDRNAEMNSKGKLIYTTKVSVDGDLKKTKNFPQQNLQTYSRQDIKAAFSDYRLRRYLHKIVDNKTQATMYENVKEHVIAIRSTWTSHLYIENNVLSSKDANMKTQKIWDRPYYKSAETQSKVVNYLTEKNWMLYNDDRASWQIPLPISLIIEASNTLYASSLSTNFKHLERRELIYSSLEGCLLAANASNGYSAAELSTGQLKTDKANIGIFPLLVAADLGDVIATTILLRHGAHINRQLLQTGQTPLHRAILNGNNTELNVLLLERGADITIADNDNSTILHLYAAKKTITPREIALLTEKLKSIRTVTDILNLKDGNNQTIQEIAARNNNLAFLALIRPYSITTVEYKGKKHALEGEREESENKRASVSIVVGLPTVSRKATSSVIFKEVLATDSMRKEGGPSHREHIAVGRKCLN